MGSCRSIRWKRGWSWSKRFIRTSTRGPRKIKETYPKYSGPHTRYSDFNLGAEYLSPKTVNLLNSNRFILAPRRLKVTYSAPKSILSCAPAVVKATETEQQRQQKGNAQGLNGVLGGLGKGVLSASIKVSGLP